ncbi:hypothetical protein AB205_0144080 [Aquarana catesbeiana]|uniref:INTS8 TPR repeats domain-containing protein n=1 Tax=Aquarana catesbeiana TaxID=8400 RepID=A0A2G9SFE3_AQUCT|nr:hypothetical protein AB205_0144080 [Aquarana catesbeiana]
MCLFPDLHHKRGEVDKRQIAIKAIGQPELNASNPEEVLQLAAQRRKKTFLQAMAKLLGTSATTLNSIGNIG